MRVVVTCTTLPNRYTQLDKMLTCLKNQTYPIYAVYLTLPMVAKRFNQPYPDPPLSIKNKCTIVRTDVDYGPLCKLYGALVSEHDPDTMLITVDDDCHYPHTMVEMLVKHGKENVNSAICGSGALMGYGPRFFSYYTNDSHFCKNNGFMAFRVPDSGRLVDLVYGFGGVLYRRSFFPHENNLYQLFDYTLLHHDIFCNDDVLISGHLKSNNIKMILYNDIPCVTSNDKEDDALSYDFFNMFERLNRCVQRLQSHGMFQHFEPLGFDESCAGQCIIIAIIVLIIIILSYFLFHFDYYI